MILVFPSIHKAHCRIRLEGKLWKQQNITSKWNQWLQHWWLRWHGKTSFSQPQGKTDWKGNNLLTVPILEMETLKNATYFHGTLEINRYRLKLCFRTCDIHWHIPKRLLCSSTKLQPCAIAVAVKSFVSIRWLQLFSYHSLQGFIVWVTSRY